MFRLSPAVQLSLGLVFLMVSIFIVAQGIGLTPSQDQTKLYARQKLSEHIALQTTLAIKRDDQYLLVTSFELTTSQTDSIVSLGLRKVDGSMIYQTGAHQDQWKEGALARGSSITHVRIPMLLGGEHIADLEIVYTPLMALDAGFLGLPKFGWLIIFLVASGFTSFWIYIKRVLHHLDPSSVVPARVKNALNIMKEGVVILDQKGKVVLANHALSEKIGVPEKKLSWSRLSDLPWVMGNNASSDRLPWLLAQKDRVEQSDIRMMFPGPEGRELIFKVNSVPILDEKQQSQGTMTSFDDITEIEEKSRQLKRTLNELVLKQKIIEEKNQKLNFLASRDPLTNCLNRRSLFSILDSYFSKVPELGGEYTAVMMDIDHFKNVNDTYGHGVGDSVIKFVSSVAISVVGQQGYVARFGGEEFCILLPETPMTQALNIAEMCRRKIDEGVTDGVKVTSSFGVTSIQFGAKCGNDLIHQADEALYESKETGRNRVTPWSPLLSQEQGKKQAS